MQLRIWIITILLAAGLAACATEVVPMPQQTPETALAEPIPVTVERVEPTLSVSPIPTDTPVPTSTPIPIRLTETPSEDLSVPRRTSTPLEPTPEPTPLPLKLQQNIQVILAVDDIRDLSWSPTNHEFVLYSCPNGGNTTIQLINLTNETFTDVTPADVQCYVSVLWHSSGEYFLFSATTAPQENYEGFVIYGWEVDRNDLITTDLGQVSHYWDWLNNDIVVYEDHVGTGTFYIGMFDTKDDESISSTYFDGRARASGENYVILNEEIGNYYNTSVAVLAQESISPEYNGWLFGSDIKFFGKILNDSGWDVSYYSRFAGVLSYTDQVLAVTWEEPLLNELDSGQLISGTIPANLQLLDAQTDDVAMVLPGGIYGRFSPDGSMVAALTPDVPYPNLQLFNYPEGEKLLSLPAYAETTYYAAEVFAFTTFSPNGRYFTFFTPETDLVVYDIQTGEMLPPITAVPAEPLWSPDSTHFVYTDPASGLSIYDTDSQTTYPLAESGGERLSNPQWSFDGTYLSVAYRTDHHTWETAVISLP